MTLTLRLITKDPTSEGDDSHPKNHNNGLGDDPNRKTHNNGPYTSGVGDSNSKTDNNGPYARGR